MGYESERALIEPMFFAGMISASFATTDIAWENVKFEPEDEQTYVSFRIVHAFEDQASLGDSPLFRAAGFLSIAIMTPEGTGTATAKKNADKIAAVFRGQTLSGIIFRAPRIEEVGNQNGYYQLNIIVPFQRDEVF